MLILTYNVNAVFTALKREWMWTEEKKVGKEIGLGEFMLCQAMFVQIIRIYSKVEVTCFQLYANLV